MRKDGITRPRWHQGRKTTRRIQERRCQERNWVKGGESRMTKGGDGNGKNTKRKSGEDTKDEGGAKKKHIQDNEEMKVE